MQLLKQKMRICHKEKRRDLSLEPVVTVLLRGSQG